MFVAALPWPGKRAQSPIPLALMFTGQTQTAPTLRSTTPLSQLSPISSPGGGLHLRRQAGQWQKPLYMLESMSIDGKRKHRALVSVSDP